MEAEDSEKYTGLREDIEFLLQQFLNTQNVRFHMFAEEWRKLNFTFIHYGIERAQEKKEAMQEAFRIATEYFLPPYDLQRRVGALYILYAVYMTQPYVPKFKIRISLDQWQKVILLVDNLQSQGHLDALYVFHKMTTSKAFVFTVTPKKMIFHNSYMEGKLEQKSTERWLERHRQSLMTECFDDNTLEVHHGLHEQYQQMKVKLSLHDNTSLMVVRESITEYIVKRFEKLETDFEASHEVHQTTDATDSSETEDRSSKISKIKARSYSTVTTPSRSRRHRQQTGRLTTSPDTPAPKSTIRKGKRRRRSTPLGADKEKLTKLDRKRRGALISVQAIQKKRMAMVKKVKTVQADIYLDEDVTEPSPEKLREERNKSSDDNSEASTTSESSPVRETAGPSRSRKKPSPASDVAPKIEATASGKAHKQCTPRKAAAKATLPSKPSEKRQETPRKRRRSRSDITPKKRVRGSEKIKAETSKEKFAKTPEGCDSGLKTRAHQYLSPPRGQSSSPNGQVSPKQDPMQSSVSSPRGLRSASVRGRGLASGSRGKGSPSRSRRSPPENQKSPLREQREMPGQMRSPRSNLKLKMRGGGIGAKTRGARQKHP